MTTTAARFDLSPLAERRLERRERCEIRARIRRQNERAQRLARKADR